MIEIPLVPTPKQCDPSVKKAIQILTQKLGLKSVPIHASITLTDLTASSLVGTNASKLLESVTVGTGLDYTRPTLSLSHLGIEVLTDPNADKILFWDDSATACAWLGVGNSIAITTTTLDTIQDIRTIATPTFARTTLTDTCLIAGGANFLRVTGLQTDATALTGTLRGAYIDVSNGSLDATGTIRALELKARTEAPGDTGNNVAVLEGLSISADSKAHNVTTMRAAEFILDGSAGGTITEAVGLRIANNLQADKATNSYALQIYSDSFPYTYGIDFSNAVCSSGEIKLASNSIIGSDSVVLQPNTDSITFFQVKQADGTGYLTVDTANKLFGLGVTPTRDFHLSSTSALTRATFANENSAGRMIMELTSTGGASFDVRTHGNTYVETLFGNSMTQAAGMFATGNLLFIVGNFSNADMVFGTNNKERMRITAGGNIGIGEIVNPEELLHLARNLSDGSSDAIFHTSSDGPGDKTNLICRKSRNTVVSPNAVVSGDALGAFDAQGYDGSDYLWTGNITMIVQGTVSTGIIPTGILFNVVDSTGSYITAITAHSSGNIGFSESVPETLTEWTGTAPYLTLHNSTHEDTNGGRESRLNFKGEQSGGEETTLARIEISHDGAADDEKGKVVISTNDGSDVNTPTEALTIDSARNIKTSGNTISDSSGNLTSANGANFGPAGVTSITVVNGIVTAIS